MSFSLPRSLRWRMSSPKDANARTRTRTRNTLGTFSSTSSTLKTPRTASLPVLDILQWYESPEDFMEGLRCACHTVGFFFLRHDIPMEVLQQQMKETRDFFQYRTIPEKLQISYENHPNFRGYMKLGVESTQGVVDCREQIEYATEDNQHLCHRQWPPYERLRGNNPWPPSQPSLRKATRDYLQHITRISDCLRNALCQIIKVDQDVVQSLFGSDSADNDHEHQEKPHWALKLVSYPPLVPRSMASGQGVGAHTDTNFLTLILQDNVGGLQVFSQGQWMDVPPLGNMDTTTGDHDSCEYLVCNLGEQAEILSSGYFLATPHRVVLPTGTSLKTRISIPFFYNPLLTASIVPQTIPETLPWERDNGSTHEKDQHHWRMRNNEMLATVGDNTFKSLARSHPVVFHKHHPDLMLDETTGRVRRAKTP